MYMPVRPRAWGDAAVIQTPKLVLRVCIPLLGRFAIPPSSFDIVPRHASADVVHGPRLSCVTGAIR